MSGPKRETEPIPEPMLIREALLDLSAHRGYRNTTLAMVLDRAGVDRVTFERHFSDLEDCFCQIYRDFRDEFLDRLARACEDQPTWRDRIRTTAYELLRSLQEDESRARLVTVEVRQAGERAQILLAEGIEAMVDLVDEGRSERCHPRSISGATAEALSGAILGQIVNAVQNSTLTAEAVPQLMYSVVLPYLGSEAAQEELSIPPPASLGVDQQLGQ